MSKQPDKHLRAHLPIPEVPKSGLTTYDAKDPDTTYPPIEPLRPPAGAPNVLIILLDDAGFGSSSAFGGPCHTPTFEKLAAGGLRYNRFQTCGAVRSHSPGSDDRSQPPLCGHGQHHRDRHIGSRPKLATAQHKSADGLDPEVERLLHSHVRQVPRSAGLGKRSDGAV